MKKQYTVTYLCSKDGLTVRTQSIEADDETEAYFEAFDNDYYYGKTLSVKEE